MASILKKIVGHKFKGELWVVHPDLSGNNLVLQTRDGESVAYHLYSLSEGKFLWEDKTATGLPTQGIREIAYDTLIIYQRLRTEFLGQEGLTVLNLKTGEENFSSETISMAGWKGDQMVVEFNGLNRYGLLNLPDFQVSPFAEKPGELSHSSAAIPIQFPAMYGETEQLFKTLSGYLAGKIRDVPSNSIDYLEYKDLVLIGYYTDEPNGMAHKLVILDQSGAVVDNLLLGSSLHGIGIDTFVIVNHHLLTIRDKHELEIYSFFS